MTVLPPPRCPTCRGELSLESDHEFDAWVCPTGHGLAFTLSEAYERLRDDEIHAIWQRARAVGAPQSSRLCPMCATIMVAVACQAVTLDVCLTDEVLWLDAGEVEQLPADTPEQPLSPEEQAALEEVTEAFGDALTAGWEAQEQATLSGRLSARLLRSRTAASSP